VVDVAGTVHQAGDVNAAFTLMSTAKPFTLAAVVDAVGADAVRDVVGIEATGLAFNDVAAVERVPDGRTNPMVNPGAIAVCSLIPGHGVEDRWRWLIGRLSEFAGRPLEVDDDVLASASATNYRNRELAAALAARGAIASEASTALDLYTRQSSLRVEAVDLATMGATLADGGRNPVSGADVVTPAAARAAMVAMTVAGMYERSGSWLWDVGLPGKSGISGAMVTVSPGQGALASYSPPLDAAGNSVRGGLAAAHLSRALGLDMLAAEPWTPN
jgi:glutaminase